MYLLFLLRVLDFTDFLVRFSNKFGLLNAQVTISGNDSEEHSVQSRVNAGFIHTNESSWQTFTKKRKIAESPEGDKTGVTNILAGREKNLTLNRNC